MAVNEPLLSSSEFSFVRIWRSSNCSVDPSSQSGDPEPSRPDLFSVSWDQESGTGVNSIRSPPAAFEVQTAD